MAKHDKSENVLPRPGGGVDAKSVAELRRMRDDYCPYCNSFPSAANSDEHVIPRSIGGDERTVIKVCKACNDFMGSEVDIHFARCTPLSLLAAHRFGKMSSLKSRQEEKVKLKDGRTLTGYLATEQVSPSQLRHIFLPHKRQADGSIWVSERKKGQSLPAGINVFDQNQESQHIVVAYQGFDIRLARGTVKIVYGLMYAHLGSEVRHGSFDQIRRILKSEGALNIPFYFARAATDFIGFRPPHFAHTIYWAAKNGKEFRGFVGLHGVFNAAFCIPNFYKVVRPMELTIPLPSATKPTK